MHLLHLNIQQPQLICDGARLPFGAYRCDAAMWDRVMSTPSFLQPVRSAYQPPASSTFLSEQTSHQQPASSTLLSEQTSTSHQPPANRTGYYNDKGVWT
jgi:hypothetical protein